jgi:hypothetical protein
LLLAWVVDTDRPPRCLTATAALLSLGAAVGLAPRAGAAAVLPWSGTFTLELVGAEPSAQLPPLVGPGVAIAASWPSPQTLRLRGGISDAATRLVTDPVALAASGLAAVRLSLTLGIGTLAPFPPLPFGELLTAHTLPAFGNLRFCLLSAACSSALALPLAAAGGDPAVGVGGLLVAGSGLRISLEAAPWTVGTATRTRATSGGGTTTAFAFGFVHGPASASGTTAASGGELQLVTPLAVTGGGQPDASGFGRLRLRFVPEPGAPLLLGSALLALLTRCPRRIRPEESSCAKRPPPPPAA